MQKILFLMLSSIFITSGFDSQWKEFTSEKGCFKILFPGKPSELSSMKLYSNNAKASPAYVVTRDGESYRAAYFEFPSASSASDEVDSRLEAAKNRLLVMMSDENKSLGTLSSSASVNLNGFSGIEISASSDAGNYKARIYLVKKRVYLLLVSAQNNNLSSETSKRFFDSLSLLACSDA